MTEQQSTKEERFDELEVKLNNLDEVVEDLDDAVRHIVHAKHSDELNDMQRRTLDNAYIDVGRIYNEMDEKREKVEEEFQELDEELYEE